MGQQIRPPALNLFFVSRQTLPSRWPCCNWWYRLGLNSQPIQLQCRSSWESVPTYLSIRPLPASESPILSHDHVYYRESGLYLFLQVQYPLSLVSIKYKHFLIFGWGNNHDHHFINHIVIISKIRMIIIITHRWANFELSDLVWLEASSLDWKTRRPARFYHRPKSEGIHEVPS